MSDLFEHFADLPIASFVQSNFQPGVICLFDHANLCRCRAHAAIWIALFCDGDSASQAAKMLLVRLSGNFNEVGLGNVRGSFHQLVGQCSVVRQQQQPLAVVVETTYGIQARLAVHELHYSGPPLGIGDSRDVPSRLVESNVFVALRAFQQLIVDADRIDVGISFAA